MKNSNLKYILINFFKQAANIVFQICLSRSQYFHLFSLSNKKTNCHLFERENDHTVSTNSLSKLHSNMSQPYKKAKLSTPEKRSQQNTHDLLLGIDFEDDWINEFKDDKENAPAASNTCWEMDLSHWTRCIVDGISRDKFDLIFKLRKHKQSDLSQLCRIQPPWTNAKVNVGDVVSVKAVWSPKYSSFVINSENGYLVNLPDQLISGTSVMGSLFCARKGVLQEFFKGLDGDNEIVMYFIDHETLYLILSISDGHWNNYPRVIGVRSSQRIGFCC